MSSIPISTASSTKPIGAQTFDASGKEVGIPLFEATAAIGLTRYEAHGPIDPLTGAYPEYEVGKPEGAPPVTLSDDQIQSSYSTFIDAEGREKIYRIRGITNNEIIKKYWEILTPQGIDQVTDLKNLILKTNAPASLNYVQDLDQDNLPADVEYFLRTSDSPLPLGALVPGATDETAESVRFNTDPGLATGSLVRVTDTATGGGLTAGVNYYFRKLDAGNYSFYDTAADAIAGTETGRVNLTGEITAGIFSPTSPATTNTTTDSVSFDPGFATGTAVLVSQTGGGLTAGVNYYIRNLGGGNYSFYDTAAHANDTANEDGRSNLTGNIVAGISTSPTSRAFNPASTDFTNQSVTFDPGFATGTVANVTSAASGLLADTDYFLRNLGDGSYQLFRVGGQRHHRGQDDRPHRRDHGRRLQPDREGPRHRPRRPRRSLRGPDRLDRLDPATDLHDLLVPESTGLQLRQSQARCR